MDRKQILGIIFKGEWTDFNTYSTAERTHRQKAAEIKEHETLRAMLDCKDQKIEPIEESQYPLQLHFAWYVPYKKKDPDNIAAAKKFILDGMQKARVIKNDGWNQIDAFSDSFHIDKEMPRVEVSIYAKM